MWELKGPGSAVAKTASLYMDFQPLPCLPSEGLRVKKKRRSVTAALISVLMLFLPYYFYPCTKQAYGSELSWATAELSRNKELKLLL